MAVSPLTDASEVLAVEITSNGARIADSVSIVSVATRAEMMRIPEAVIVLDDGDVATSEFPLTDGSDFVPGAAIVISAGYGDAALEPIFEGIVVEVRLKIDGGDSRLIVTCRDKAVKLTLGRRNGVSRDVTDSDAISALVGEAGLSAEVTATSATHKELVQYRATDWDFIVSRAEVNGMLVRAEAGKVVVAPPDYSPAAALLVTYGIDLIRFDAEIDARSQLTSAAATGWSNEQQATLTGTAGAAAASGWGNLTGATLAAVAAPAVTGVESPVAMTLDGLEGAAKARQARAELARIRGTVRFQGSAKARLGTMLELAGLGARFSGTGLVCSVVHRLERGAWTTDAGLGLDPDWLVDRRDGEPGAAGLTLPAGGLQIGKVAKLTEDPQAQNRIQVKLPLLGDDASVWARLGGVYATNAAGMMFLPEINDEVVVGFFNDDPNHAVVLGSLHSSTSPPPLAADEKNKIKTIITPQKLKLEFDDDKKKVTVATPGGNSVVLDDDGKTIELADQNGNKVTLAAAGITLDSAGDVTIKAGKNVAIQASADVKLKGLNVAANADVGFAAQGQASAEVKASGTVTVKGAMVMIN